MKVARFLVVSALILGTNFAQAQGVPWGVNKGSQYDSESMPSSKSVQKASKPKSSANTAKTVRYKPSEGKTPPIPVPVQTAN